MVDAEAPGSGHDAGDLFAMRRTVIEFANSVSHPDISAHYFLNSVDEITGILSGDKTSDKDYVREYFSALAAQIKYYCNIKIYVSVSLKCDNVLMLPQCFEQALNLAHRKVFENDEITAFYRVQKKTDSRFPDFIFDYDAIWQNIIKGNADAVFAEVDRVFSLFESDSSIDYKNIEQICIDFLFFLSRRSMKFNISFEQIMEENGIHYEDIRNTVNLVRRKAVITDCLKALIDCISQSMTHSSKSSSLAQVIKDFCDKEYMENYISLEYIAGKVSKSVAYISKIFKDEFGVNFSVFADKRHGVPQHNFHSERMNAFCKIFHVRELTFNRLPISARAVRSVAAFNLPSVIHYNSFHAVFYGFAAFFQCFFGSYGLHVRIPCRIHRKAGAFGSGIIAFIRGFKTIYGFGQRKSAFVYPKRCFVPFERAGLHCKKVYAEMKQSACTIAAHIQRKRRFYVGQRNRANVPAFFGSQAFKRHTVRHARLR